MSLAPNWTQAALAVGTEGEAGRQLREFRILSEFGILRDRQVADQALLAGPGTIPEPNRLLPLVAYEVRLNVLCEVRIAGG